MINQVKTFGKTLGVTGLIITKLDGTAKGGALISIAKKYANQLTTNLKIMNENSANISKLLKHFESNQLAFEEINEMLNKIKSLNQEHTDKTKRNVEILDNLESIKDKKIMLQTSIDEIHSSEDFKKYVALENKLNEFLLIRGSTIDKCNCSYHNSYKNARGGFINIFSQ